MDNERVFGWLFGFLWGFRRLNYLILGHLLLATGVNVDLLLGILHRLKRLSMILGRIPLMLDLNLMCLMIMYLRLHCSSLNLRLPLGTLLISHIVMLLIVEVISWRNRLSYVLLLFIKLKFFWIDVKTSILLIDLWLIFISDTNIRDFVFNSEIIWFIIKRLLRCEDTEASRNFCFFNLVDLCLWQSLLRLMWTFWDFSALSIYLFLDCRFIKSWLKFVRFVI